MIEQNPALEEISEIPFGKIPEMVILHEKDSHYNLVVPVNSRLALEGGLDLQRAKESKDIDTEKDIEVVEDKKLEVENKSVRPLKVNFLSWRRNVFVLNQDW